MVAASASEIAAHSADLSRLDAVAGDGDHGVIMTVAMARETSVALVIGSATPAEVLEAVAAAFFDGPGGASGALFGSFFRAVANGIGTDPEFSSTTLAGALAAGALEV